jgi:uncharacterized protein YbbC (DUF1343 family)
MARSASILFGVDVFINLYEKYKNKKIALVTNNAATTTVLELSKIALLKNGFNIIKLFSPEHGISSQGEDGIYQQNQKDEHTGLPVVSLYADKLMPDEKDMAGVDLIVFDLPDIGCRFYTYQWTLSYIMEACAKYNKPLIVLDRPNPISGNLSLAEGPLLDEINCSSFIGRWSIPLRHSLTIGELSNYWNKQRGLNIDLTVVPVKGWQRNLFYDDLNIPFVPTSPGIPDFTTALLYPGMGLLEGINVSEGRGTATPFKICGAPWTDAATLSNKFNQLDLPGVNSIPVSFVPGWGKYEKQTCNGIELILTDKNNFSPAKTGLSLINLLMDIYPQKILPYRYKTVANPTGENHLDKLTGIKNSWGKLSLPVPEFKLSLSLLQDTGNWKDDVKDFLLY